MSTNLTSVHRAAVLRSVTIVAAVTPADLDRPTPCADWNLGQLLAHMTVQHRGFAAAARGRGADIRIWDPATVTDPAANYAAAAHDALDAFSAPDIADRIFALPEFGPDATVPGSVAIAMHFVDYVVHGWDVAVSLGKPYDLPDGVIAAALPIVLSIPEDAGRDVADPPFGPSVPATGATDFERLLAHLGRRPDWSAQPNSTVTGA